MPTRRAKVRPRVILDSGSDAVAIDTLIADLPMNPGEILVIVAGPGCGKTSCLDHLAAILSEDQRPALLDEPESEELLHAAAFGPVVCTARGWELLFSDAHGTWRLAKWERDDLIEYALATDPAVAKPVIARALALYDRDPLGGFPAAWSAILDILFEDQAATDLRSILDRAFAGLSEALRTSVQRRCMESVLGHEPWKLNEALPDTAARLIRCESIRQNLAVRFFAGILHTADALPWLERRLPREFVNLCAESL